MEMDIDLVLELLCWNQGWTKIGGGPSGGYNYQCKPIQVFKKGIDQNCFLPYACVIHWSFNYMNVVWYMYVFSYNYVLI